MLLTLVLATAIVAGAPIYRCDPGAGKQEDVDCEFAIAAWKAGWQPIAPDKSVVVAEKRLRDRADANLLARFPNQDAYWKARQADLAPLMASFKITEARISSLMAEQAPRDAEMEFYPHVQPPMRLKLAEEAIRTALVANTRIAELQQGRIAQANAFYDRQLVHLMHLWGCTAYQIQVVAEPVLRHIAGGPMALQTVAIGRDGGGLAGKCGISRSLPD
jgi:hypothetical protein